MLFKSIAQNFLYKKNIDLKLNESQKIYYAVFDFLLQNLLLTNVGNKAKMLNPNNTNTLSNFIPKVAISLILSPIDKLIIFKGISPKNVPTTKCKTGMPAIGKTKFRILLGNNGLIR